MTAIDRGQYWALPLQGETVSRCCVDTGFNLEFGLNKPRFVLRIEGRLSISKSSASTDFVVAERESLGPCLALFGNVVEPCHAAKTGALEIVFNGGLRLNVEPDVEYEAWELATSADGLRVVCGPGGKLSIWQP